jgi:CRP-like cAMP-binding protein
VGTSLHTAELGSAAPLTCKLAHLVKLSADEKAILFDLQSATRDIPRNREIIAEGERYDSVFVVIEGVLIRYRILRDGRRQIVNIILPGDFVGITGCLFEGALYSVRTLTRAVLSAVPFARLNALGHTHPRLANKIFWSFSCEAAMYAERLIAIGRRSALERVAHFLLELLRRLQVVGLADERSYRIPLTQELIADALGLSIPHVNRVLRQLRDEALVGMEGQQITIRDMRGLCSLAEFEPNYLNRFSFDDSLAGAAEPLAAA